MDALLASMTAEILARKPERGITKTGEQVWTTKT